MSKTTNNDQTLLTANHTNLKNLSDHELHMHTIRAAQREQRATLVVLEHLTEVRQRRLYARRGFSSFWEYCIKALGYSEAAEAERLNALKLMQALPEIKTEIENKNLTLTTVAAVQRFVQKEQKERLVSVEEKKQLVAEVSGKSKREVERILFAHQSNPQPIPSERAKLISETVTQIKFCAGENLIKMVERIKELKGDLSYEKIFEAIAAEWLESNDPVEKMKRKLRTLEATDAIKSSSPRPAEVEAVIGLTSSISLQSAKVETEVLGLTSNVQKFRKKQSRYISVAVKLETLKRSEGQCEYFDQVTKRRCSSKSRLQWDHVKPYAHGGMATAENIRHLCPEHNRLAAIDLFGQATMDEFLN